MEKPDHYCAGKLVALGTATGFLGACLGVGGLAQIHFPRKKPQIFQQLCSPISGFSFPYLISVAELGYVYVAFGGVFGCFGSCRKNIALLSF